MDSTISVHVRERFDIRARALFYSRLALMTVVLIALAVPFWRESLNISLPSGAYWYLLVLAYQVGSYIWGERRFAQSIIFGTLCLDLLAFLYLVAASGGLKSPLMPTQLVFTMLFALLYPSPLAIIPPLLTLPMLAKLDQILGTQTLPGDLLLLLWYSALNITVVYVMVYLEGRERAGYQEVIRLQRERRQTELDNERARIAREIHDSVGASLSSVLLQVEYLKTQSKDPALLIEMEELRESASDGMEELRRAVSVMRREFHLPSAAADLINAIGQRHHIKVALKTQGMERDLDPEPQLILFRVLQEALTNVIRHAAADGVEVLLSYQAESVTLVVQDNGCGFEPEEKIIGHYGLRNMSERAEKVGGLLRITSTSGQGARVEVQIPIRSQNSFNSSV